MCDNALREARTNPPVQVSSPPQRTARLTSHAANLVMAASPTKPAAPQTARLIAICLAGPDGRFPGATDIPEEPVENEIKQ
jgi:hypothetical protein